MNDKMETYLAPLTAAVETKDKKALELLDGFSAYVYQDIYARANNTTGVEQVAWNKMLQRVKVLIGKMAQAGPQIW